MSLQITPKTMPTLMHFRGEGLNDVLASFGASGLEVFNINRWRKTNSSPNWVKKNSMSALNNRWKLYPKTTNMHSKEGMRFLNCQVTGKL